MLVRTAQPSDYGARAASSVNLLLQLDKPPTIHIKHGKDDTAITLRGSCRKSCQILYCVNDPTVHQTYAPTDGAAVRLRGSCGKSGMSARLVQQVQDVYYATVQPCDNPSKVYWSDTRQIIASYFSQDGKLPEERTSPALVR